MTTPQRRDTPIDWFSTPVDRLTKNQLRAMAQHLLALDARISGTLTPDQKAFIHRHFPTLKPKRDNNRR
jgi:hypothetical protein